MNINASWTMVGMTKKLPNTTKTAVTGPQAYRLVGVSGLAVVGLEESFDIDNSYQDDEKHKKQEAGAHNALFHLLTDLLAK